MLRDHPDAPGIFARRAALLRELAELEEDLGRAVAEALSREAPSEVPRDDEGLGLVEAARFMGERPETFRRRLDYRRALISRPGERRLRYSRMELERIRRDRIASNAVAH
jgi:hypothetical protein